MVQYRKFHERYCYAEPCDCPILPFTVEIIRTPPSTWGRGPVADLIDMQRTMESLLAAGRPPLPDRGLQRGYAIYCETCLLVGDCVTSEMAESLRKVHKLATGHETIIKETV